MDRFKFHPKARRKSWTRNQLAELFIEHKGICWRCELPIQPDKEEWHAGHVGVPHAMGGHVYAPEHKRCNMQDCYENVIPMVAKSNRVRANHLGIKKRSRNPVPGGKNSKWKRKVDGTVVPRRKVV